MRITITPKPPEDRSMTRESWKVQHRYCRVMAKHLEPYVQKIEDRVIKSFAEMVCFGRSVVRGLE